MMNILNCFVHFYLFQSIGENYLFDMIKFLIGSFTECDIEILIFALHNIGLQLRKKDPESLKNVLDLFNQKRNSYFAEKKLNPEIDSKSKEQKLKFLVLELEDIRNNKGSVTLQVRSIEHLQVWLKRDARLSNELLIRPLDVSVKQVDEACNKSQNHPSQSKQQSSGSSIQWWNMDPNADPDRLNDQLEDDLWNRPTEWKEGSRAAQNQISKVAKKHNMFTDVKKAVFSAIVNADDYL